MHTIMYVELRVCVCIYDWGKYAFLCWFLGGEDGALILSLSPRLLQFFFSQVFLASIVESKVFFLYLQILFFM